MDGAHIRIKVYKGSHILALLATKSVYEDSSLRTDTLLNENTTFLQEIRNHSPDTVSYPKRSYASKPCDSLTSGSECRL
jgi:hypothetical protein